MYPAPRVWSVLRSVLHEKFTFGTIKAIAGHSGIDLTAMAHLEQRTGGPFASKSEILSAIDREVGNMDTARLSQFLRIVTEEMLRRKPEVEPQLRDSLERLGWTLHERTLLEVPIFDPSELPELPTDSHVDLVKAASRLRDGDLTGAVSAACAAVDAVTTRIYGSCDLGDPGKASFQEKVNRCLAARNLFTEVERQLTELGWGEETARIFTKNLQGSLNQAAYVMQSLRSQMGDVHGSRPVLKPLVFDSLKWATIIVRVLA